MGEFLRERWKMLIKASTPFVRKYWKLFLAIFISLILMLYVVFGISIFDQITRHEFTETLYPIYAPFVMQGTFNLWFWIIMLGVYRFIFDIAWEMVPYLKKTFPEQKAYLLPRILVVMMFALGIIALVNYILIKVLSI